MQKDLEKELEQLQKEKQEEKEENNIKLAELRKNISEEVAEKCEKNKSETTQILEERLTEFSKKWDNDILKIEKK